MGSPQAIIIGQYCSDFTIEPPLSGTNYWYYSATSAGDTYYLATGRVTDGSGAADVNAATGSLRIIKSPFAVPNTGIVNTATSAKFNEFRFRPMWYPSITPDIDDSPITSIDMRRYLTWNDVVGDSSGQQFSSTKRDRFVILNASNDNINSLKFGATAATITSPGPNVARNLLTNTNVTAITTAAGIRGLAFTATGTSPTITVNSQALKYLILKDDFDIMGTQTVTSTKSLRYLVWNVTTNRFEMYDLYDPDVSTQMIQRCAYRFSQQTTFTLTGTPASDAPTEPGQPSTTWGVDVYANNSMNSGNPVSIANVDALRHPPGFTNGPTQVCKALFGTNSPGIALTNVATTIIGSAAGFSASAFSDMNGTAQNDTTLSGTKLTEGFQGLVFNVPVGFKYWDCYTDPSNPTPVTTAAGSPAGIAESSGIVKLVITNQLVDKQVEELFTDVHVTLLKVRMAPASPATGSPTGINDQSLVNANNDNYLGLEGTTAGAPSLETVGAVSSNQPTGGAANNRSNDLIVRSYYKFFDPIRATQFKFYDLGRGTNPEYLWQARWPSGSSEVYAYVVSTDETNISYAKASEITSTDQRGWVMEWENGVTPPGIRLKWASTNRYVRVIRGGSSGNSAVADNDPMRIAKALTTNKNDATIFNCVQCSQIDPSTGACVPVTGGAQYLGTSPPPGLAARAGTRTTVTGSPAYSPAITLTATKIRLLGSPATITRGFLVFTETQVPVGGSPVTSSTNVGGSPIFVFGGTTAVTAVQTVSSPFPSPAPVGTVSSFIITNVGGTLGSAYARSKRAVFIKAATGTGNRYIKYNQSGATPRVELISSNAPSDDDGFAWIIQEVGSGSGANRTFNLFSVSTQSPTPTTGRYLSSSGTLVNSGSAATISFDSDIGSINSSP
jgi:hypothetical protein